MAGQILLPASAPIAEGSLECALEIRRAMTKTIQTIPESRYVIAARMSELLGEDVTKAKLDAYTAPTRVKWRMPLEYAPAFDAATGTHCLLELFARKRGANVMVGSDAVDAEIGRLQRKEAELREQRLTLMAAASIGEHMP